MATGGRPSLFFRGIELLDVQLPSTAEPGTGRVLALERYADGLIVRAVIEHPVPARDRPRASPLLGEEVTFSLVDDGATPYRFAGAVSGGHPTSHVLAMFTPAAPAAVRWLEVASPLGRARFEFSR